MTPSVLPLVDADTWAPEQLLKAAFAWPSGLIPTQRLRDVTATVPPQSFADAGTAVITPADIDPVSGGLFRRNRNYAGPAHQVREAGDGLVPGDLLLPLQADVPALRVQTRHIGSIVSRAFLTIRPPVEQSEWIWAVLSSRSGSTARAQVQARNVSRTAQRADLLDLEVPVAPPGYINPLRNRLNLIEAATIRDEEEPPASWWRRTTIDGGEWHLEISLPNPSLLDNGIPLEEICTDIATGRIHLGPAPAPSDIPDTASRPVPLATVSTLSGRKRPGWVIPEREAVARPGDVLVARLGIRPYATVASETTAAGDGVFVLKLREPQHAVGLARFLNSASGVSLRRMLSTGSTVPSISRTVLGRLPVPRDAIDQPEEIVLRAPLADELEAAIWP